jgi:hypothetical protein
VRLAHRRQRQEDVFGSDGDLALRFLPCGGLVAVPAFWAVYARAPRGTSSDSLSGGFTRPRERI